MSDPTTPAVADRLRAGGVQIAQAIGQPTPAPAPAPEPSEPPSSEVVDDPDALAALAARSAPEALAGLVQTVAELDRGLAVLDAEARHYVRAPAQRAAMLDTVANLRLVLAAQDTYLQLVVAGQGS